MIACSGFVCVCGYFKIQLLGCTVFGFILENPIYYLQLLCFLCDPFVRLFKVILITSGLFINYHENFYSLFGLIIFVVIFIGNEMFNIITDAADIAEIISLKFVFQISV